VGLRYRCRCLIYTLKRFFYIPHSRGEKKAFLLFQDKTSNSYSLPHTLPHALSITVPILAIQKVTAAATTITALKYCYYYSYCCCYQYYYLLSSFHYFTTSPATYPLLQRVHTSTYTYPTPSSYISHRNFYIPSNYYYYCCSIPYRHLFTGGGRSIRDNKGEKIPYPFLLPVFYPSILFIYIFNFLLCSQNQNFWEGKDKKNPSPPLPSPHCLPHLVPQKRAKGKGISEQCQANLAVVGNHRNPTTPVNRTIVVVKPQTRVQAEVTAAAAATPTAVAVVRSQPSMEIPTGTLRLPHLLASLLLPLPLPGPSLPLPTLPLLGLQLQSHIRTSPRSSNCLRPPATISNTTYHVFSAVTG